ncbi:uncharacterized protein [Prorops nasuta]|uniref:uncharacterized protein n=1 Tax=Prorops nasuta TaxID=863751 RepID=UPI0034CE650F
MTCKKLYYVINNEQAVCKRKCFHRWTWMQQVCEDYADSDDTIVCWKKVWEDSLTSIKKLRDVIDNCYNQIMADIIKKRPFTRSALEVLSQLISVFYGVSPLIFELVKKEFTHIFFSKISHGLNNSNGDLAELYRIMIECHKTYLYDMNETYFTREWRLLIRLPAEKQTLSKFGILALEWLEHKKYGFKRITSKASNSLAKNTMLNLHKTCPEHPIFSVSQEKLNFWRDNVIEDNQWNYIDGRKIAEALRVTMLESDAIVSKSGCRVEFVPKMLELSVILESTGRRLGLRCECAVYSNHIFLKWKECCENDSKPEDVYLDIIHGGEFLKETNSSISEATIGNCIIIDDHRFERMQREMSSLHEFIDFYQIFMPDTTFLKKCLEIYETMQASYEKRSYLEVNKLKMQAGMICRVLERLVRLRGDHSLNSEFDKFLSVILYFTDFDIIQHKENLTLKNI